MSNQVFIRNISYNFTEENLSAIFESIGPLKRVSIGRDKEGKSKGFGFVKFALSDDASKAVNTLQGHEVDGRRLKLEIAVKKGSLEEAQLKEQIKKSKPELPAVDNPVFAPKTKHVPISKMVDGRPQCQVLVFGLPDSVRASALRTSILGMGFKAAHAKLITPTMPLYAALSIESLHPSGRAFIVNTANETDASAVANKLNGMTLSALNISAPEDQHKKRRLKSCTLMQVTDPAVRRRKNRLIVRNLAFTATREIIQEKLDLFGPIVDVEIPLIPVTVKGSSEEKLNPRGFCFVTYLCERDAAAAVDSSILEAADGGGAGVKKGVKICNRFVAVDYCVAKDKYMGKEEGGKGVEGVGDENDSGNNGDKDDDDNDEDNEEEEDDDDDNDKEEDVDDDNDEDEDNDNDDNDEEDDVDDDEEKTSEAGIGKVSEVNSEDAEEKRSAVDGCTVFVRDLSSDVSAAEIRKTFSAFGPVATALIVKDKDSGQCKGSAFVRFHTPAAASKCLSLTGELRTGPPLLIGGRPCRVDLALEREAAEKIKGEARLRVDRRHLYLCVEGQVSGPAEGGKKRKAEVERSTNIPEGDKIKRARVAAENKKKLLNPLVFVSTTRLSVRNMSKGLSDDRLRNLCLAATKVGLSKGVVGEHDLRAVHMSEGNARPTKEDLQVPAFSSKAVRSAKIRLDMQRLRDGKAQSRGFAFVEFSHHAYALACLRELNNNPAYSNFAADGSGIPDDVTAKGLNKARLIVEFSLEDKRKVQMLEARDKRNAAQAARIKEGIVKSNEKEDEKTKSSKRKREDGNGAMKPNKRAPKVNTDSVASLEKRELTPAAKKRKQDQRRREKEHKRKMKKNLNDSVSKEKSGKNSTSSSK